VGLLDSRINDEDADAPGFFSDFMDEGDREADTKLSNAGGAQSEDVLWGRAIEVYNQYQAHYKRRFKWLRAGLFDESLYNDLTSDAQALIDVLHHCGQWDSSRDAKLNALAKLLAEHHPNEKVLVFSQFADTVDYLTQQLQARDIEALAGATGDSEDPTALAWRFSPVSNEKRDRIAPDQELRVLIATDVLSEGQNLQDCAIVVNYDLPWAIIRLIQRAGRVDRIGQQADSLLCYSFLPAEGVERIIRLRSRVRQRLAQNAEVVGADEAFFEDDQDDQAVLNLYNEKAGILDDDEDSEVDLSSYAYQIWKNAITRDPALEKTIPEMPAVVYATRAHIPYPNGPEGALVYLRTAEGNDALAWIDRDGKSVTESQYTILKAAQCGPDEPALERLPDHHELVANGVKYIVSEEKLMGGQLGSARGARFRIYERLKNYAEIMKKETPLLYTDQLERAIDDIYHYPLRESAKDTLNRQLRSGASNEALVDLVVALREEDKLCIVDEDEQQGQEPRIICSMGLRNPNQGS